MPDNRIVPVDQVLKQDFSRIGMIPIVFHRDMVWYGLALSNFISNLTTIGGSTDPADETVFETLNREYQEETKGLFGPIINRNYLVISEKKRLTYLLPIPFAFTPSNRGSKAFFDFHLTDSTSEISTLIWIGERQLAGIGSAYTVSSNAKPLLPLLIRHQDLIRKYVTFTNTVYETFYPDQTHPFFQPITYPKLKVEKQLRYPQFAHLHQDRSFTFVNQVKKEFRCYYFSEGPSVTLHYQTSNLTVTYPKRDWRIRFHLSNAQYIIALGEDDRNSAIKTYQISSHKIKSIENMMKNLPNLDFSTIKKRIDRPVSQSDLPEFFTYPPLDRKIKLILLQLLEDHSTLPQDLKGQLLKIFYLRNLEQFIYDQVKISGLPDRLHLGSELKLLNRINCLTAKYGGFDPAYLEEVVAEVDSQPEPLDLPSVIQKWFDHQIINLS